jgi:hypothetical protein
VEGVKAREAVVGRGAIASQTGGTAWPAGLRRGRYPVGRGACWVAEGSEVCVWCWFFKVTVRALLVMKGPAFVIF